MKNTEENITKFLDDILVSSELILIICEEQTFETFLDSKISWKDQDSVARRLSIIGEASSSLLKKYPEFCDNHPEISFRKISRMRNILIHEYGKVDWKIVWDTMNNDIPKLVDNISKIIDSMHCDGFQKIGYSPKYYR